MPISSIPHHHPSPLCSPSLDFHRAPPLDFNPRYSPLPQTWMLSPSGQYHPSFETSFSDLPSPGSVMTADWMDLGFLEDPCLDLTK
ncbi:hypothetical protein MRB53_009847 [Persea americana]|uniref:Uncharacterized protein n=2 Tax=Persea americana TaxID=3435 RepID=A0ACC2LQ54_PERAE|nr:hypothetical protein MRB53_009840 [Persea americana]KAJ8635580.1 hypothetical protein MRB53_009847 [Persea americana]